MLDGQLEVICIVVHFGGNESKKDLLKAKGIIKDDEQSVNILEPKQCPNPNCRELNKPDAKFCFKCNFVMTLEEYYKAVEERKHRDEQIHALPDQVRTLNEDFNKFKEQEPQHVLGIIEQQLSKPSWLMGLVEQQLSKPKSELLGLVAQQLKEPQMLALIQEQDKRYNKH